MDTLAVRVEFSIGKVLLIVICQFLKRLAILSICCSDSVLAERLGSIPAFSRINRSIRSWVNPEKAFLIDLSVLERLVSSFFKEPNFFSGNWSKLTVTIFSPLARSWLMKLEQRRAAGPEIPKCVNNKSC